MLSKVGRYRFAAEPFHCDFAGGMFLSHAANCMLNAAEFHSDERGYGMHALNAEGCTWVLSRLVVEMSAMPPAYSSVDIDTWVEGVMRFFTSRDFAVSSVDGQVYGYGRSIWAMIDSHTRQPVEIVSVDNGLIAEYVDSERACPIKPFARVKISSAAVVAAEITAGYSDVDVNGHVNSAKYIEHILDLWGMERYAVDRIARLDIAYLNEALCGDKLSFRVERQCERTFCVGVMRSRKGESDVEACRARIVFAPKEQQTQP